MHRDDDIDQIEQNMLLILFSLTVHTKKCRQVSLEKYSYTYLFLSLQYGWYLARIRLRYSKKEGVHERGTIRTVMTSHTISDVF
jgi:hypothetical protein